MFSELLLAAFSTPTMKALRNEYINEDSSYLYYMASNHSALSRTTVTNRSTADAPKSDKEAA